MSSPKYTEGDEWIADQFITTAQTLLPTYLAIIRSEAGIADVRALPDPLVYATEERIGIINDVNATPMVMVVVGESRLVKRMDVEQAVNVPPVITPLPAGGQVYLWRTQVRIIVAMHLDRDNQDADDELADTVDDWELTTRLRSRYSLAVQRMVLGHQVLVPGVLVVDESEYTATPAGAVDQRLNRRYAETIHSFYVLNKQALGLPALGYVDPVFLMAQVQVLVP